jgi:gas vesicle protein
MTRSDAPGTIFTFILGIAVGAVAALLLAPKSGEDLRADIAEGVSEGADQVRRKTEDLKKRTQKLVDKAKDHVQDAIEAGEKEYSQAKTA